MPADPGEAGSPGRDAAEGRPPTDSYGCEYAAPRDPADKRIPVHDPSHLKQPTLSKMQLLYLSQERIGFSDGNIGFCGLEPSEMQAMFTRHSVPLHLLMHVCCFAVLVSPVVRKSLGVQSLLRRTGSAHTHCSSCSCSRLKCVLLMH